jgi:hypothetical protein
MGSAAGMKEESSPTTSGIPHGTESENYFCFSSLDLHRAKKISIRIKSQNARGQGSQAHFLKIYE